MSPINQMRNLGEIILLLRVMKICGVVEEYITGITRKQEN